MIQIVNEMLLEAIQLGGPVVIILMMLSVLVLSVLLYKLWQFSASGVGRHRVLNEALQAWDAGHQATARETLKTSKSYLAPVARLGMSGLQEKTRLEAEAETSFAKLEKGFRLLDTIAQLAPLLGLFGTVLGMISAFQSLQDAGAQVDPSILAGGIWVALLTTAAGLVVAMPTAALLSWFESLMDTERVFAEKLVATLVTPGHAMHVDEEAQHAALVPA